MARVQAIQEAAVSIHPEILVLCHGGAIAEPEDVRYVLDRTRGVCGFFGAPRTSSACPRSVPLASR